MRIENSVISRFYLLILIISFCILLWLVQFSPSELLRSAGNGNRHITQFRIVDLPINEVKEKPAIQNQPNQITFSKESMPLTEAFSNKRGDPHAVPKNVFHQHIDYKPFVLPPPLRVKSMTFTPFITTSQYYLSLKAPSSSCSKDICKKPADYINQFAKWDCSKHPSLCENLLVLEEPKYLIGNLDIIENGIIDVDYDCGWPARHERSLDEPEQGVYGHFKGSLVFLNVPQGLSFQHFIDGVIPKLVQLKELIQKDQSLTFAMDFSFVDNLPMKLLERIEIPFSHVVDYHSLPWMNNKLKADRLILACRVPPLHPDLWMNAQTLLKLPWMNDDWIQKEHVILYFSRNQNTRNMERRVLNEDEVVNTIGSFAKSHNFTFAVFNSNDYPDLDSLFAFMANVDIVIGPHGGAFYNLLFMRRNIKVIEFMPQDSSFLNMQWAVHLIIYLQANMLGNYYYNIQGPSSGIFDMTISTSILADTLEDCL